MNTSSDQKAGCVWTSQEFFSVPASLPVRSFQISSSAGRQWFWAGKNEQQEDISSLYHSHIRLALTLFSPQICFYLFFTLRDQRGRVVVLFGRIFYLFLLYTTNR